MLRRNISYILSYVVRLFKLLKKDYIQIIIGLLLLYYYFKIEYLSRYLLSFFILIIILLYKMLYNVFTKNKLLSRKFKIILKKKEKINKILIWINFILSPYIIWLKLQEKIIKILRMIRYKLKKKKKEKLLYCIEVFSYFIIFIVIGTIFELLIKIKNKVKEKIIKTGYKDCILWRFNLLVINIVIIRKIIEYTSLDVNKYIYLFLIIILLYIIINILKNIYFIYYNWYNKYISYICLFLPFYNLFEYNKYNYFFKNCNYEKNNLIITKDYLSSSLFNGNFKENPYWFDRKIFKYDMQGIISGEVLNKFIVVLNYIIFLIIYLRKISLILKKQEDDFVCLKDIDYVFLEKKNEKYKLKYYDLDKSNFMFIKNNYNLKQVEEVIFLYEELLIDIKVILNYMKKSENLGNVKYKFIFEENYYIVLPYNNFEEMFYFKIEVEILDNFYKKKINFIEIKKIEEKIDKINYNFYEILNKKKITNNNIYSEPLCEENVFKLFIDVESITNPLTLISDIKSKENIISDKALELKELFEELAPKFDLKIKKDLKYVYDTYNYNWKNFIIFIYKNLQKKF